MTTADEEPTEAELREAEALARALDRGRGDPEMPEDALGTAAFLRFAKDGGALDPDQARAILADALARARPPRARPAWRWRIFGVLGLAAAGAAALLIVARAPIGDAADTLPAPPRALLEAQIDAAGGRVASLDALAAETRDYRTTVYGALRDRYGR
jgi:hypothetical protein